MTSRTYSVMDAAVFSHARDRRNSGSGLPKYYAIKAVAEALDVSPRTIRRPQGVNVVGFKQPTREELDHDFLWRIYPYAPGLGRVAIFNPSHYEDVLIARVHRLVPKDVWKPRFGFINNWEKLLVSEKNTTILKFFLLISKEEQLARFKERLDDAARQWKISESDYTERKLWDDYIEAFEAALANCSADHAPWFVIPSNHNWFRNFAVSQILADALDGMKLDMPRPTVDLKEIRRLYHKDVVTEEAKVDGKRKARRAGKKSGKK